MLVVLGLFLIAMALVSLLFSDTWWELHAWGRRTQGVQAERTPEWDSMRRVTGVLLLLSGLGLLGFAAEQHRMALDEEERRERRRFDPKTGTIELEDAHPRVRQVIEESGPEEEDR